jgi:hypothetical protein
MGAEWFDACSALMAFCKHSEADPVLIMAFQNCLIRLFSMLHAAALGDIEDVGEGENYDEVVGFSLDLIDAESIDEESLRAVQESNAKVELIFQWIQQLVVTNIKNGVLSIPPPILSRSFQEIATGMVHFHEAMKISNVPFPFPYAQTCDCLLCLHWLMVPFIVCQWVTKPWWAGLFCFIQVFTLWTLNLIAVELENPFGTDANDIDGTSMQETMNNSLRVLLSIESLPIPYVVLNGCTQRDLINKAIGELDRGRPSSFQQIFSKFDEEGGPPKSQVRRFKSRSSVHKPAAVRRSALDPQHKGSMSSFSESYDTENFRAGASAQSRSLSTGPEAEAPVQQSCVRENGQSGKPNNINGSDSITDERVVEDGTAVSSSAQACGPTDRHQEQGNGSSGQVLDLAGKWEPWENGAAKDNVKLLGARDTHDQKPGDVGTAEAEALQMRLGEIFFNVDTMEDQSADEILSDMSPRRPPPVSSEQERDRSSLPEPSGTTIGAGPRHSDPRSQYGHSRATPPPPAGMVLV